MISALAAKSDQELSDVLREAGLRPTRQRMALAELLFAPGDRHITAEALHEEAIQQRVSVSLATVYNTLHQFTQAGLLREVAVEGSRAHFDTNTSNHYHFFCEESGELSDIPDGEIHIQGLPAAPDGKAIARVDVLIRLIDKTRALTGCHSAVSNHHSLIRSSRRDRRPTGGPAASIPNSRRHSGGTTDRRS